jgi:hypothetical protein
VVVDGGVDRGGGGAPIAAAIGSAGAAIAGVGAAVDDAGEAVDEALGEPFVQRVGQAVFDAAGDGLPVAGVVQPAFRGRR